MATVEVKQANKLYNGREVLARLDLWIGDGELICLLGPSGCGKTTLLRIIAGFIRPDSGQVLVSGEDVTALPPSHSSDRRSCGSNARPVRGPTTKAD